MGSIDKMIQWMKDREGKVTYSQGNRLGPNSYDCSSAVYYALIAGGFLPAGNIGWTGTLAIALPTIAKTITRAECKRGDVFLSKSQANDGHTGIFMDNAQIIHCTSGKNGIYTTPASGGWLGPSPTVYYRLNDVSTVTKRKAMECFYAIDGQETVYYFDGQTVTELIHRDERNVLNQIYKANYGTDMPELKWKSKAPFYVRLGDVLNRTSVYGTKE